MLLQELDIRTSEDSLSINDLRELYFNGEKLSKEQQLALTNFDKFRLLQLEKVKDEPEFHQVYFKIQAMANLADFRDFLDFNSLI